MTYALRSFVLYLAALLVGAALLMYVVPFLAIAVWKPHLPWTTSPDMAYLFGHHAFIRAWLIWLACAGAALVGFFMTGHRPLRRAILTLPAWVPAAYSIIYMMMVMK